MLNASVGLQRVLARLRPTRIARSESSVRFHRRSVQAAQDLRVRAASLAATAQAAPRSVADAAAVPVPAAVRARLAPDAILPVAVVLIVLGASVLSWLPGLPARGAVGDTSSTTTELTPVFGPAGWDGGAQARSAARQAPAIVQRAPSNLTRMDPEAAAALAAREAASPRPAGAAFLADGTLLKPIVVDTTLADGKHLLESYTVRKGDSMAAIAKRFGVSLMSVVWANNLRSTEVRIGQQLVIPPFNGVVLTVKEGQTLDGLAKEYEVDADEIYQANGLEDRVLIAGQTLILPGATGDPLPTPRPTPRVQTSSGGGSVRPPTAYTGGAMVWPVVGGGNYISQYYRSGHYGLDIAADYGSSVRAAAGGTVTFAGWKNNGGGYQVWIAHGSGLYTTYNHMSGVSVGVGQHVGRGQQVGRIGASGMATGPHLHFEVWRGPIWNGGTRVNPLSYL